LIVNLGDRLDSLDDAGGSTEGREAGFRVRAPPDVDGTATATPRFVELIIHEAVVAARLARLVHPP
jgi:hypothetical protein